MASTRRDLFAGALAGTAVPALARAATPTHAPMRARRQIVRRGRAIAVSARGHHVVVAHDRRTSIGVAIRGRRRPLLIDVGGQPVEVAIAPDGRTAAVTTAFWEKPGLAVVALPSGTVHRLDVGPAPSCVTFTPDGRQIVVSGGEQEGTVVVVDARRLKVVRHTAVGIVPRGLAVPRAGGVAWVALNGLDQVAGVDLHSGRITRTLATPELPDRVAVAPDGDCLLVSHGGREADQVSEITIRSGKVDRRSAGRLPSGVAWTDHGLRLVALGGTDEIVAFTARGTRTRHRTVAAPRGLAVSGHRAWTVSTLTGRIGSVRP